jgi:hypothetical protein
VTASVHLVRSAPAPLVTALSSSGSGEGPMKGPLLGTNPAIEYHHHRRSSARFATEAATVAVDRCVDAS